MKWIVVFLALCSSLIAEEDFCDIEASKEKVLDTRENYFLTSTDYRITPKVNPISGEYCEEEMDLVVSGSQPLSLRRFYNHFSPYDPRYASWRYNPESFFVANLEWSGQEIFAAIGEADGGICSYQRSNANPNLFDFHPSKNFITSGDGTTHPLNTKISYWRIGDPKDKHRFQYQGIISDGSGRVRSFTSPMHRWTDNVHYIEKKRGFGWGSDTTWRIRPNTWTPYHIPIQEEKLPNGNILCYSYTQWKEEKRNYPRPSLLNGIVAYNSSKTKILGYINLYYPRFHGEEVAGVQIVGSDGRQAFIQHASIDPILLWSARRPDQPSIDYGFQGSTLNRVEKPDGRVLTTEYNGAGKVAAQHAPVGPNGEMCPIGRYEYQDKATITYDAENNKTIYLYDENKKITAIETYQGNARYRTDRFTWDGQTGSLLRKSIEDASGTPIQITEYQYDKKQNPIVERVGDGREWYTIARTFTDDGFNLKLSETDREGKKVCYEYVPGTNLLKSEFIYAGDTICRRTFRFYDDCAICVKTIIDDGSNTNPNDFRGITYRRITEIQPKQSLPCFGLPEIVQEKTIDPSGQEILLSQVIYSYTSFGKILEEKHYDAKGTHCYSIHNSYDDREHLISTTDPLGNATRFSYDANNNLIAITGPKPAQHKEIRYDKANRPIRIADWQTDGVILTVEKRYNKLGQVIAEIDACGNITRLEHDSSGRVTAVYHPDDAIERKEYDILGNVIKSIDGEGYETRAAYNFRGKPIFIFYPDGKEERFTYHPTGEIASYKDKNGTLLIYQYDIFDNPIRVEMYSGPELLKVKTAVHTPFCKLSETDGEGIATFSTYDFSGRKIAEQTDAKKTCYFYDSLGRLETTDVQYFQTCEEQDHANRPIVKRLKDASGNLQFQEKYAHDEAGNRTHRITSHGAFETLYNTFGKPLSEKNPLGFVTTHEYLFGKEHTQITTYANGIKTLTIYDARGREAESFKKNLKGEIIFRNINRYNKNGNLIELIHFVFDSSRLINTIAHRWEYGPMGRIERFIEAGEKETGYAYDQKGRLSAIVKPSPDFSHFL
jgi:YD repeat-containing protein